MPRFICFGIIFGLIWNRYWWMRWLQKIPKDKKWRMEFFVTLFQTSVFCPKINKMGKRKNWKIQKNWKRNDKNWKIQKIEKNEKIGKSGKSGKSGKLKNWQIMKIKIQIDRRFWRPNIQELGIFGQKLYF